MCRVRHQCNSILKYNIIICLKFLFTLLLAVTMIWCPFLCNAVPNLYYAKGISSDEQLLYVFLQHVLCLYLNMEIYFIYCMRTYAVA
jgi:hypothetical protein